MAKRTDYKAKARALSEQVRRTATTLPLSRYADDTSVSPAYAAGLGRAIFEWLDRDRDAAREIAEQAEEVAPRPYLPNGLSDSAVLGHAQEYARYPVTWADQGFTELLTAAALIAAPDGVLPHQFGAGTSGQLVFEQLLRLDGIPPVRMLTWWWANQKIVVEAWGAEGGSLRPVHRSVFEWQAAMPPAGLDAGLIPWLAVVLNAVADSPRVRRIDWPMFAESMKPPAGELGIRQLSMVKVPTDDGMDPELAAALGRPTVRWSRGRWIRGMHPSGQCIAQLWIDGFAWTPAPHTANQTDDI